MNLSLSENIAKSVFFWGRGYFFHSHCTYTDCLPGRLLLAYFLMVLFPRFIYALYLLIVWKRSSRDRDSRKGQRKPYKYWDVAPIGYENMTPMQYKALQGECSVLWQYCYCLFIVTDKSWHLITEYVTCKWSRP